MDTPHRHPQHLKTRCCITGGGPAGIMLGYFLARGGIDVTVLEKHADFFRDFRGDTLHPSTLELMQEAGLLENLLKRPHQKVAQMTLNFEGRVMTAADFSSLPVHCPYIALMPQWDFLDFMAGQAKRFAGFQLRMSAEVTDLIREGEEIRGVTAQTPEGPLNVEADLVIGADGRHSTVRQRAGLKIIDHGVPIDVLWFHLPRGGDDPQQSSMYLKHGQIMILLDREDYWQCGLVIPKGTFGDLKREGIGNFQRHIAGIVPFIESRTPALKDWEQIKLLTVKIDHLRQWHRAGLLCIGDAAHAMSPVGGVGINLAVQDAVAAARFLAPALKKGKVPEALLKRVQSRREGVARMTQRMQQFLQGQLLRAGAVKEHRRPPLFFSLLGRFPALQRLTARMIGIGLRPEHPGPAEPRP